MSDPRTEHALHLALLALQTGLIDRAGFEAVLDAWNADRSRDVASLLADRGPLSPEALTLLQALAARHTHDLGTPTAALTALAANAGPSTVDELLTRAPDFAECFLSRSTDVDETFVSSGPEAGRSSPTSSASNSTGVRYRAIRFHARGGLGAVFVAMDEELKRNVALKEIQDHRAHQRADRERFIVEAEITGKLEHPGIVPVYGLGTYADGRPFYAMRFIHGESLRKTCNDVHATPNPDPSARSLQLRGLLRRFLDVCNAVEYAHSRGVLHRDLKPGNIMVGKYGETLVVDWGLARIMGKPVGSDPDRHDAPIDPASLSGSARTVHGHAIGTPGYMSPEQAEGKHDELGPPSDVYSLGATLYFLLTGKEPFTNIRSLEELYERIRTGDFPPPRSINPEISKQLDAICRKAMAVLPTDRYSSPRALADDLEHFLADEPVEALPDTRLDRALRWTRRHRQATVSAALALMSVTLVAIAASFLVDAARRSEQREAETTRKALQVAEDASLRAGESLKAEVAANAKAKEALHETRRAQAEAEENFKKAQQIVDDFLTAVSESKELQLLPDTQAFRRKLLEKARDYYRDFLKYRSTDQKLRFESGMASLRLSRITKQIGTTLDATELCKIALDLVEPIATSRNSSLEQRSAHARILANLASLKMASNQVQAAEQYCQEALRIREKIAGENLTSEESQVNLGRSLNDMGTIKHSSGRLQEAEDFYSRSLQVFEDLRMKKPEVAEYADGIALTLTNLAYIQRSTGRADDAIRSLARAVMLREALVQAHPRVTEHRSGLVRSLNLLGAVQQRTGDTAHAATSAARAAELAESLVRENPKVVAYRDSLTLSLTDLVS